MTMGREFYDTATHLCFNLFGSSPVDIRRPTKAFAKDTSIYFLDWFGRNGGI